MEGIRIEEADYNSTIDILNKPYKSVIFVVTHSYEHYDSVVTAFADKEDAEKFCADNECHHIVKTYIL